ncbi:MAG: hypothetical protein Q9162_006994, partial [Coniocarpon cinnabarinum]
NMMAAIASSAGQGGTSPRKEANPPPPFPADQVDGSPAQLPTSPSPVAEEDKQLDAKMEKVDIGGQQAEDKDGEKREEDIYADKVLQCSIENKEACVMCSG